MPRYLLLASVLTAAISGGAHALAATLHEGVMVGQVQQQSKGSEIDACGVTLSAIEVLGGAPSGKILVFNGSVMIYGLEGGLIKGRASELDARLLASGKADFSNVKPLPTVTTWMKAPGKPLTTPRPGTTIRDSDDKGYRIYASDFDSVYSVIDAIIEKQVIQVGMKTHGSSTDRVLFGTVKLSEAEQAQLLSCMSEWGAAMKRRYKVEDASPVSNDSRK